MEILGFETRSAKLLAEALADHPLRLRWGGPCAPNAINGSAILLNPVQQFQLLSRQGIPTLECTTNLEAAFTWTASGRSVLGRKLIRYDGHDIVIPGPSRCEHAGKPCNKCRGEQAQRNARWNKRDYWTPYYPSAREWVFDLVRHPKTKVYKCVYRAMKYQSVPKLNPLMGWTSIRLRRFGWSLITDRRPPVGFKDLAKRVIGAFDYDLGQVVIMEHDAAPRVISVSSRPVITPDQKTAYASGILEGWING